MSPNATQLRKEAEDLREKGEYQAAGDKYTLGAYAELSESDYRMIADGTSIGLALFCLLSAGTYYNLAGQNNRCQNRCKQGVLITQDLRRYVAEENAHLGLLFETQGDFELLGNLTDPNNSYTQAEELYQSVSGDVGWSTEPAFEWNWEFFTRMSESAGHPLSQDEENHIYSDLTRRVAYKQKHFSEIIASVFNTTG